MPSVCEAAELTPGHVYNVLRGERCLALETVKRLRPVLPEVSDAEWASGMLAPCVPHTPEASAGAAADVPVGGILPAAPAAPASPASSVPARGRA